MAAPIPQLDTEALMARLAQLEQDMARRKALTPATRYYKPPANYYEHRSPSLPPPLERRDYSIQASTINMVTQHLFSEQPGKPPIHHDEELNQLRPHLQPRRPPGYKPGTIGWGLNNARGLQNQSPTTNALRPRQHNQEEPCKMIQVPKEQLNRIDKLMEQQVINQQESDERWRKLLAEQWTELPPPAIEEISEQRDTTSNFKARQQSFVPSAPLEPTHSAEPQDKLEPLLQQLIIEQQKTNEQLDSMYADLNGKFESLSSHVQRLSLQVDQNAEWAEQRQGEQEPTEDSSRLVIPTTTEEDHKTRIEQEEETAPTDTLKQQSDPEEPCQSVPEENEFFSTRLMEKPAEPPTSASVETPVQQDAIAITITSRPATKEVEPPRRIYNPPSGTSLLKTSRKKDDPEVLDVPCSIKGDKFEGSMCRTSTFQRSCPPSPPRRPFPRRIPRSPKVHPPDTGVRIMMVARIHHQQLLYAKYSGVDGEDPGHNSQAK